MTNEYPEVEPYLDYESDLWDELPTETYPYD